MCNYCYVLAKMSTSGVKQLMLLILNGQLQQMFQSLKKDCGAQVIHQSHKNKISPQSLVMYTMMANNKDILAQYSSRSGNNNNPICDTYRSGMKKLRERICDKDIDLKIFKNHLNLHYIKGTDAAEEGGCSSMEEGGSEDDEM